MSQVLWWIVCSARRRQVTTGTILPQFMNSTPHTQHYGNYCWSWSKMAALWPTACPSTPPFSLLWPFSLNSTLESHLLKWTSQYSMCFLFANLPCSGDRAISCYTCMWYFSLVFNYWCIFLHFRLIAEVLPPVVRLAHSPILAVRHLGAHALVSLVPTSKAARFIVDLFESISKEKHHMNMLHGTLCQIQFLLKSLKSRYWTILDFMHILNHSYGFLFSFLTQRCPVWWKFARNLNCCGTEPVDC